RTLSPAPWREGVLSHGKRRAQPERGARRGGTGTHSAGVDGPDRPRVAAGVAAPPGDERRLDPDQRPATCVPGPGVYAGPPRPRRHLPGDLRGPLLRLVRGVQGGERARRREVPDPPHPGDLRVRRELLLPSFEVSRRPAPPVRGRS